MTKQYRKRNTESSSTGLMRSFTLISISFISGYLVSSVLDMGRISAWVNASLHPLASKLVPTPEFANHEQKPKLEFYTLLTTNNNAIQVPPPPVPHTPTSPQPSALSAGAQTTVASNNRIGDTEKSNPSNTLAKVIQNQKVIPVPPPTKNIASREIKSTEVKTNLAELASKTGYTIQVAALKTRQDAERMKASLLLRGFQVSVNGVATNGVTWFRVMVGPFTSRAQAEETQSILLRRERVNGMIKKMDA